MKKYRLFWFSAVLGFAYITSSLFWFHHSPSSVLLNAALFVLIIYLIECQVFRRILRDWWYSVYEYWSSKGQHQ
jgi:hypothetical protein